MTLRRIAATVAAVGAVSLAGAPFAAAAPAPKPADPTLSRAVPGTSCNVGQLRAAIDRSSPGLTGRLEQIAGGPQQFADIATSDPTTRQFKLAGLAFTGSAAGLGIIAEQQNVQRALADAYRTCGTVKPAPAAKPAPAKK
ncbi:Hemophore-related protein OS=Tsukamurella paurometabola (strain ATCC 8368 / DSM / CCUG 35730/ CIP 100753 / JCM 10117 / KCTC 9821 / NBRC 16120 / NCIMB 702349/ NCTC 13040) OX=521096 GN=Tpau_2439 PE=4 SV=1 [Tsukamurella paurometabola]|uniref:Hemophore-related protein n=1 Tax=Tsukamurella paurometabola (strain ATCC 8368 / DSM 20162 / CCUG 35730 / CIP 100753 / JCM 10117 / KCTC 9821 / NBRC 16120 / NCIMB 702349 / NCTC 13040) TaxID=521096 RepID=D5UR55_TSUPD|nr:hemophore-related protein [Tsukamurella paurometabola]ADG79044.1 hypothetical protein Tpau_2439 [Tsukamurella paurometabola DSM 20162]SUP33875.1 Uncharacterised protein [Tsukamurella paurometabola]